ncbi:MAG: hypothetical protein QOG50_3481 [Actinomycetota bacterium]|nr:hypothetical protein [Actinomycetota bacterium]
MFVKNAADVPASQLEDCHHEAGSQILGGLFLLALPGATLLLWTRLRLRLPTRLPRPPGRPSRFGPKPVEVALTTRFDEATATERLRTLGNGGPAGSLRVRFGHSGYVDARLVLASARFSGTLSATDDGSQLCGAIRPSTDDTFRIGFMVTGAIITAIVSLTMLLAGASSGRIDLGFLALAVLAALFAVVAYWLRRLIEGVFPVAVNGLSTALASALDTSPPPVPIQPRSTRNPRRIGLAFIALQLVAFGARIAVHDGVVAGVISAAIFAVVAVFVYRASRWWRPRLQGTELHAGFRRLDLTQVNDVRARSALMSLSDSGTRIVVSSALGRPEALAGAQLALTSPDTSQDLLEAAQLFQAVGDAVSRCPLDERTAATLHRPVTMPGVSRPGPRFDPSALVPVLIMLGSFALALALLATWR